MAQFGIQESPKQHWIISAMRRRWIRLTILFGIAVFELGFIWFVQHFGWLESVNIWTQIGVVSAALSPLVFGALILVRKRFKLSSMMIALSLFAVFLGLSLRPVYDARQARVAAKILLDAGVEIGDRTLTFEFINGHPSYKYREAEKCREPDWVLRLIGDYASMQPANEILSFAVKDREQLDAFAAVADQLPNLDSLAIDNNIDSADLSLHGELIKKTPFRSLGFRNMSRPYGSTAGKVDLRWLEGSRNLEFISFWDYPTAIDEVSRLNDCEFQHLEFQLHPTRPVDLNWKEIFSRPVMQRLKYLTISGYELGDDDAAYLSQLQNLEYLNFHSSNVSDFAFLAKLPRLVAVSVTADLIDDQELRNFPVERQWRNLVIRVPKSVSDNAVEDFKERESDECKVHVIRR